MKITIDLLAEDGSEERFNKILDAVEDACVLCLLNKALKENLIALQEERKNYFYEICRTDWNNPID